MTIHQDLFDRIIGRLDRLRQWQRGGNDQLIDRLIAANAARVVYERPDWRKIDKLGAERAEEARRAQQNCRRAGRIARRLGEVRAFRRVG